MTYEYIFLHIPTGKTFNYPLYSWPKKSQAIGFLNKGLPWNDDSSLNTHNPVGLQFASFLAKSQSDTYDLQVFKSEFEVIRVKKSIQTVYKRLL